MRSIPLPCLEALRKRYELGLNASGVRCAGSNGVSGMRSSIGYLTFTADGKLVFVARRWFRYRFYETPASTMSKLEWSGGFIVDAFAFEADGKRREFEVFRPLTSSSVTAVETAAA